MAHDRVFDSDELLLALLPTLGPRAGIGPPRAMLKWAGPKALTVARSTLEFSDYAGALIERREGAFGLRPGSRIDAPYSHWLCDDRDPPGGAEMPRWSLNEWAVAAPESEPESEPESAWSGLVLTCLPLQLPLAHDIHFVARIVNVAQEPLNIARGVREAMCWVDGVAWQSVAGRIWNGLFLVHPGHTATRSFRLADFPGASVSGSHEVALEMLARSSEPQRVRWHGTPWAPPTGADPPTTH